MLFQKQMLIIAAVAATSLSCRSKNCTEKVIPRTNEKSNVSCSEGQYIDVHDDFVICKCQPY